MNTNERYHHGDLHKVLLETALKLIDKKGVSGFSLREVAREAGVSHGAPAHHFKDKCGLMTAIAADGFRGLANAVESAVISPSDQPIAALKEAGTAYVRFAADHPAHFEVMFRPELHQKDNAELMDAAMSALSMLRNAAENIQKKESVNLDLDSLVLKAWSTAHGLAQLWLTGNLSPTFEKSVLDKALKSVFSEGDNYYFSPPKS